MFAPLSPESRRHGTQLVRRRPRCSDMVVVDSCSPIDCSSAEASENMRLARRSGWHCRLSRCATRNFHRYPTATSCLASQARNLPTIPPPLLPLDVQKMAFAYQTSRTSFIWSGYTCLRLCSLFQEAALAWSKPNGSDVNYYMHILMEYAGLVQHLSEQRSFVPPLSMCATG